MKKISQLVPSDLKVALKDTFKFYVYYFALALYAALIVYAISQLHLKIEFAKIDTDFVSMFDNYVSALSISRHFVFILCFFIIFSKLPVRALKTTITTTVLIYIIFVLATLETSTGWFTAGYQFIGIMTLGLIARGCAILYQKYQENNINSIKPK